MTKLPSSFKFGKDTLRSDTISMPNIIDEGNRFP
jgi:hypothetical protein